MTFPILIANKVFLQPCIKLGMPKVFFLSSVMQCTLQQCYFKKHSVVHPATVHMHTNTDLFGSFILC